MMIVLYDILIFLFGVWLILFVVIVGIDWFNVKMVCNV